MYLVIFISFLFSPRIALSSTGTEKFLKIDGEGKDRPKQIHDARGVSEFSPLPATTEELANKGTVCVLDINITA